MGVMSCEAPSFAFTFMYVLPHEQCQLCFIIARKILVGGRLLGCSPLFSGCCFPQEVGGEGYS